jgi:hypothetical protein
MAECDDGPETPAQRPGLQQLTCDAVEPQSFCERYELARGISPDRFKTMVPEGQKTELIPRVEGGHVLGYLNETLGQQRPPDRCHPVAAPLGVETEQS